MRNKPRPWLLEHPMVDYGVAQDTAEVWLVHVALFRQSAEGYLAAIQGDFAWDVPAVDCLEARCVHRGSEA